MKKLRPILLILAGLVIALVIAFSAGLYLFLHNPAWNMDRPANSVATVHPPTTLPASPSVNRRPGVAAPKMPPAQAQPASPAPAPAVETPPPGSVQELCVNLAAQLQNGDVSTIFDTYGDPAIMAAVPPSLRQNFEDTLTSPITKPQVELWIRTLQELPNLTPVLSDNGETATYDVSSLTGADPQSQLSKLTLRQRESKWYFTVSSLLIGAAGFGVKTPPP